MTTKTILRATEKTVDAVVRDWIEGALAVFAILWGGWMLNSDLFEAYPLVYHGLSALPVAVYGWPFIMCGIAVICGLVCHYVFKMNGASLIMRIAGMSVMFVIMTGIFLRFACHSFETTATPTYGFISTLMGATAWKLWLIRFKVRREKKKLVQAA